MVVSAPLKTDFLGITYPDEHCDPFYDQYVQGILDTEKVAFFSKIFSQMWITAGGTRSWSGVGGLLTWTQDFVIPVPFWGRKISVVYGPDAATRAVAVADGQLLVITAPMGMAANTTKNFEVISQLDPARHDQFVCGMRVGNVLYLKGIGELT